jgi:hypothetical protein
MTDLSTLKAELDELRQQVQDANSRVTYLEDRQQILDCIMRYTRGLDRHDRELLESAFHDDAIDNHGARVDRKPAFYDLRTGGHNENSLSHLHSITNHSCEIDGNTAHTESYVLFISRHKDGENIWVGGGRYVDRLEKRNGEWRIVVRRLVIEFRFPADGTSFTKGRQPSLVGKWDRSDVSFDRPLEIPAEMLAQLDKPAT